VAPKLLYWAFMRVFVSPLLGMFVLLACGGDFTARTSVPDGGQVRASGGGGTGARGSTGGSGAGSGAGGAGGAHSSGGVPGTGGMPSGGGSPSTGGIPSSGGIPGSGGIPSSGGVPGTGGSGGNCTAPLCGRLGLACCGGTSCLNTNNDPYNCGGCNKVCPDAMFFCSGGQCTSPPCGTILPLPGPAPAPPVPVCSAPAFCCGSACCTQGQLCCEVTSNFTTLGCYDPKQTGGTCPVGCAGCVCAAPDTPIATPDGERAIATLAVGDRVLTVDHGRVMAAFIIAAHRIPARHHHVVHVELENGSILDISAPHPTADGRVFGDLRPDDQLGGIRIASVSVVPYTSDYTYDILPDSDSGSYFAGGALVGSTLGGTALTSSGVDYSPLSTPMSR
jgi:hypothetical protein